MPLAYSITLFFGRKWMQQSHDSLVRVQVWPFFNSSWDGPSFRMTLQFFFQNLKGSAEDELPLSAFQTAAQRPFVPVLLRCCLLFVVCLLGFSLSVSTLSTLCFSSHRVKASSLPTYCLSAGMLGAVSPSQIFSVYSRVSIKAGKLFVFYLFRIICLPQFSWFFPMDTEH